jgi:hypothetical protein
MTRWWTVLRIMQQRMGHDGDRTTVKRSKISWLEGLLADRDA